MSNKMTVITDEPATVAPAIYLLVNKRNKMICYTTVNVPDAIVIREDEDPELFKLMRKQGTAAICDPQKNHCCGLGLTGKK